MERREPSKQEFLDFLRDRSNHGRWGKDDQLGTLNLVTPAKRLAAIRLVEKGETISLSRPMPTVRGSLKADQVHHYMHLTPSGSAADYFAFSTHGLLMTHVDALCHIFLEGQSYNGRAARDVVTFDGATFGSIDALRDGVTTRGVLLDVTRFRKKGYVAKGEHVSEWELGDIAASQNVELQPGDALCVYCGRDEYERHNPPIGSESTVPGLNASCLRFLRDKDCAALLWDMTEHVPTDQGLPFSIHFGIPAFGLTLVDNCDFRRLATRCGEINRYEFMLTFAPLYSQGGTGSPVNPLAIL
jgi:kynurenine formamidase